MDSESLFEVVTQFLAHHAEVMAGSVWYHYVVMFYMIVSPWTSKHLVTATTWFFTKVVLGPLSLVSRVCLSGSLLGWRNEVKLKLASFFVTILPYVGSMFLSIKTLHITWTPVIYGTGLTTFGWFLFPLATLASVVTVLSTLAHADLWFSTQTEKGKSVVSFMMRQIFTRDWYYRVNERFWELNHERLTKYNAEKFTSWYDRGEGTEVSQHRGWFLRHHPEDWSKVRINYSERPTLLQIDEALSPTLDLQNYMACHQMFDVCVPISDVKAAHFVSEIIREPLVGVPVQVTDAEGKNKKMYQLRCNVLYPATRRSASLATGKHWIYEPMMVMWANKLAPWDLIKLFLFYLLTGTGAFLSAILSFIGLVLVLCCFCVVLYFLLRQFKAYRDKNKARKKAESFLATANTALSSLSIVSWMYGFFSEKDSHFRWVTKLLALSTCIKLLADGLCAGHRTFDQSKMWKELSSMISAEEDRDKWGPFEKAKYTVLRVFIYGTFLVAGVTTIWYVHKAYFRIDKNYRGRPESTAENSEANDKKLTARQKANKNLPRRKDKKVKFDVPKEKVRSERKTLDEIFGYHDFDPSKVTQVPLEVAKSFLAKTRATAKSALEDADAAANKILDRAYETNHYGDLEQSALDWLEERKWTGPMAGHTWAQNPLYSDMTEKLLHSKLEDNAAKYIHWADQGQSDIEHNSVKARSLVARAARESTHITKPARQECVHYASCPLKLVTSAEHVCNMKCGGHHCTHWSSCTPPTPSTSRPSCTKCKNPLVQSRKGEYYCKACASEASKTTMRKQEDKMKPKPVAESTNPANPPIVPSNYYERHVSLFSLSEQFLGSGTIFSMDHKQYVKTALHVYTDSLKTGVIKGHQDMRILDGLNPNGSLKLVKLHEEPAFKNAAADELCYQLVKNIDRKSSKPKMPPRTRASVVVVVPTSSGGGLRLSIGEWDATNGGKYSSEKGTSGSGVFMMECWIGHHWGDEGDDERRVCLHSPEFIDFYTGND